MNERTNNVNAILEGLDASSVSSKLIREMLSVSVLKNIKDAPTANIVRHALFSSKNKIDWKDLYKVMIEQMPELEPKKYIQRNTTV